MKQPRGRLSTVLGGCSVAKKHQVTGNKRLRDSAAASGRTVQVRVGSISRTSRSKLETEVLAHLVLDSVLGQTTTIVDYRE
jgi:hypothetical protein